MNTYVWYGSSVEAAAVMAKLKNIENAKAWLISYGAAVAHSGIAEFSYHSMEQDPKHTRD